jgi:succinate-acetate transporter protein
VGENTLYYIVLQTCFIILTLYFIEVYLHTFISEFQVTIAGGYFVVLYFGMLTNYIHMIQEYIKSL